MWKLDISAKKCCVCRLLLYKALQWWTMQCSNAFILLLLFRWFFTTMMTQKWIMQSKKWKNLILEVTRSRKTFWPSVIPLGIIFCANFVETSFIRYVKIKYHLINKLSFLTTPVFEDKKKVTASTKTKGNNWSFKTWQMYMDRHVTMYALRLAPSPTLSTLSVDRSAICHESPFSGRSSKGDLMLLWCKYSRSYRLTHGIKNLRLHMKADDRPTILQRSFSVLV